MKKLVIALSAFSLLAGAAPSFAANQCRDKSGKFIKCPAKAKPATTAAKPKQCRDKSGKFIKCK
jgi:hypothetical protein